MNVLLSTSTKNIMEERIKRVLVTQSAKDVIKHLKNKHGGLLFHVSGGCCDGSQPMCFEIDDFKLGSVDLKVGEAAGCGIYMSADQFEYWKYAQLTLDILPGRGSGFSLEIPLGLRFTLKSRVLTMEELAHIEQPQEVLNV